MPNFLAIDTSTDICSLAIKSDNKIFSLNNNTKLSKSNQIVLNQLDNLLNQANINLNDLDLIIFSAGPGSFTGLRVAASVTQALAFANNLKVIRVSSLQVILESLRNKKTISNNQKIYIAQDARKNEIYFAEYSYDDFKNYNYNQEKLLTSLDIINLLKKDEASLDNNIYLGNAWSLIPELNEFCKKYNLKYSKSSFPDVQYCFELAGEYFNSGKIINPEDALPIYIRNNVVN